MKTMLLRIRILALAMGFLVVPTLPGMSQISSLRLNELLANSITYTNYLGKPIAWAEILNPSPSEVDLAGASLSDNPAQSRKFIFPSSTIIPPMGHLVVSFTTSNDCRSLCTGWSISHQGGSLHFYDSPAQFGALVDSLVYGIQAADYSIGRVPDGIGDWVLNTPSPGAPNFPCSLGPPLGLKINEWMSFNATCFPDPADGNYDDWIEIYNPINLPVSLAGLWLSDDPVRWNMYCIPSLSFIGTDRSAYTLFIADMNTATGPHHVPFKLSRAGEAIGLYAPDGTPIDLVVTRYPPLDISEGRMPDGSTNIILFSPQTLSQRVTASPGAANPYPSILTIQPQSMRLQFVVVSNLACTLQYQDQIPSGPWYGLTNFFASTADRTVEVIDPSPAASKRLYRLKKD